MNSDPGEPRLPVPTYLSGQYVDVRAGRSIRLWPIFVVLAILAIVAAITARPAWRALKRVRAENFGLQAEAFLAGEQWTLAFERTRSALQLNPASPRALRTAAALYSRLQTDTAYRYYDALLSTEIATSIDRENYAQLALQLGATNLAGVQLGHLLTSPNPSPRTLILGAQLNALSGNRDQALELASASVQLDPGNPTNVFTLASIHAQSRRVTERETARNLLWPFARTNGGFRVRALGTILSAPDSSRSEREDVLAVLDAIPEPTFEERILRLEALANLDPSQSRALSEEAIRTLRPKSERELRQFAEWLILHDFLPAALSILSGERAFRDRPLFLVRHRALMASGDLQKGYDLLFHPAAPFSLFELEVLRCQAAGALGNPRLRDDHLAAAALLAGTEVRRAAAITQLAAFCNNLHPAVDTWRAIQRIPRTAGLALRQLAVIAEIQGDTVGARDCARQLILDEPANPGPRLAVAYASLLLNEDVDAAMAEIRTRLESDPLSSHLRALLALGHLRQGDPAAADLALQGIIFRYDSSPAGLLAIFAAVAAANDQMDVAQKIMDRIPLAALKAEERELLRPIIALESRLVSEQMLR